MASQVEPVQAIHEPEIKNAIESTTTSSSDNVEEAVAPVDKALQRRVVRQFDLKFVFQLHCKRPHTNGDDIGFSL
jgi:hypothetical protein